MFKCTHMLTLLKHIAPCIDSPVCDTLKLPTQISYSYIVRVMRQCVGLANRLKWPSITLLPGFIFIAICFIYSSPEKSNKLDAVKVLTLKAEFFSIQSDSTEPRLKILRWTKAMQRQENENERIFFHETTGRNKLNLRQLCAIESAAKENPKKPVQLFMQSENIDTGSSLVPVLSMYPNVAVILLNVTEYFSESPLEKWYQSTVWKDGPYRTEHFSDYIRILSLYKAGGMYMDLDFVTLKEFDHDIYWNFVPEEDDGVLTGSAIHLEKGHPILKMMLKYLATSYKPDVWSHSGPTMIQRVVLKFCHKSVPRPLYPRTICKNLKVLPRRFMYPYRYRDWKHFFNENSSPRDIAYNSAALHMYNKLSKNQPVLVGSKQIYSRVAKEHCPLTYARADSYF